MIDLDNMSVGGSSTASVLLIWANGPHQWVPNGGFHLLDLTSLTGTVAYEMWKNTIGFFHLSGYMDELIMPIAYVVLDIMTHRPHKNLHKLIAQLNNNFGVMSDEDTLKELYTIKQGPKEPVKHFNTQIGYAMMRLAVAFPHAMPTEWAEETRKTHFLSRLHSNLKSTLAWEMCLDGGRHQMTYEEIKDATRWVEQREDPSMSNDLFVWENAVPTSWDDGYWDREGQSWCNQGHPQYGGLHAYHKSQSAKCVVALGLQMGPLTDLWEGGIMIDQPFNYEGQPIGYVIMRVQIDGFQVWQGSSRAHSPQFCQVCTQSPHYIGDAHLQIKQLLPSKKVR